MAIQTRREKTKVCAVDLSQDLIEYLQQSFEVFEGSLGKKVKAAYEKYGDSCRFLLNYSLPDNLHEYEIFIEDMCRDDELDYCKKEHTRTHLENNKAYYFYCQKPQTIFNPICYGSRLLAESLKTQRIRPAIKIVFASDAEETHYLIHNAYDIYDRQETSGTNHEHLCFPQSENICGTQVKLSDCKLSSEIFQSFLNDICYNIAFKLPYNWNSNKEVADGFLPLLETPSGAILSYVWITDNDITIVLPQTSRKKELLQRVFDEIVFRLFSDYLPDVAETEWINNEAYYLPNQEAYIRQKNDIIAKFNEEIAIMNQKIVENNDKFAFLHTLLTASGDELVKAVIQFLKWIGFHNVIDKDKNLDKPFNEEDIQVDLGDDEINGNKLLVIEVKGIGGTSTDAECAQIHKVVHRRGKERRSYDVHGLYIVNNEMHKEPLKRCSPPFNDTQIEDALSDERGLCYTWQLFNLYFNIGLGVISKEDARHALFDNGLVEFPTLLTRVGTPHNYYQHHTVVCIEFDGIEIAQGDSFYYCKNGKWENVQILSIQDKGQSFDRVVSGSYGFGLNHKVPNNLPLFVKNKKEQ